MAAAILPPPGATPPTTLPPAKVAAIAKAAQDFEAMAIGQMLQPMFATVDMSHNAMGGGAAEAAWKPMLVDEIAKHMARHGGLGLAQPVFAQMLRMQEAATHTESTE
jgi:peptidoglycan hydrolase FlgJ